MKLHLVSRQIIDVPSASGAEFIDDKLYVVGDNTSRIFMLSETGKVENSTLLFDPPELINDTIPKKLKPDFEAMCTIPASTGYNLMIFSSGSTTEHRTKVVFYSSQSGKSKVVIADSLFRQLRSHCPGELNIEAATVTNNQLWLFNRADNQIFQYDLKELIYALIHGSTLPVPTVLSAELPKSAASFNPGFSGACTLPGKKGILFTASVEQTSNSYDDGDIVGSYVGILLPMKSGKPELKSFESIALEGEILSVKIESVCLKKLDSNTWRLFLVTDSDGGHSELFQFDLCY